MVIRRYLGFLVFFFIFGGLSPNISADSNDFQISGRLDSSINLFSPNIGDPASFWTALGLAYGRLMVSGGSKEVKAETRVSLNTAMSPILTLDRAWIKFRFTDVRGTIGLGRISWGQGFVFSTGDLLFDSASLTAGITSDELYTQSRLLGDLYLTFDEESFAEILTTMPDPISSLPFQADSASDLAGALRFSAAPGGITLETAYAVDGKNRLQKAALSTQFHLGIDWTAGIRADIPFQPDFSQNPGTWFSSSLGCFGIFDLGEGFTLTTRHEALLRPWQTWTPVDLRTGGLNSLAPSGTPGTGLYAALYTFHSFALAIPENLTFILQGLLSPCDLSGLAALELDWAPLQYLKLYYRTTTLFGGPGTTFIYSFSKSGTYSFSLGAVSSW